MFSSVSLALSVPTSMASISCIVITAFSSGDCCATCCANSMALAVPLFGPLFGPSIVSSLMATRSLSLISAASLGDSLLCPPLTDLRV